MEIPVQPPCAAIVRTKWPTVGHKSLCSIGTGLHLYINTVTPSSLAGPALTAVWSKALLLTASCLSPLSRIQIPPGVCEKVANDLGLGGGFRWVLRVSSTSYNWLVTTSPLYGRKSDEKQKIQ